MFQTSSPQMVLALTYCFKVRTIRNVTAWICSLQPAKYIFLIHIRNKEFCWATLGSFNIHVCSCILCSALKVVATDVHHTLAISITWTIKTCFLYLCFVWSWNGALYQKLQDVQHFALVLHNQVNTAVINGTKSAFYPWSAVFSLYFTLSLYFTSSLQFAVWSLQSAVCSLHFTLTNIKVKSWPHKKETVDHIKSKLGHRNTKGILTGLALHICGCFLRICRKIWHFLISWDSKG